MKESTSDELSGDRVQKAIDPTISTWPQDDPQLIGSSCGTCSATTFPAQSHCPKCSRAGMAEVLLPRRGTVIAWTTQDFPPGPPYAGPTGKDFVPFGVGLVQLGLGEDAVVRVEGRLTENDPAKLQFGMEVELTMIPFATDASDPENPVEIVTFAFQPV
jgi:uncharacterized OB-fold protein